MMNNLSHIKKHRNRPDLPGEHRWGDLGQVVLFVLFFTVWIIDSFILDFSTFPGDHISLAIRIPLSAVLLILSSFLARAGLKTVFGEERENQVIIRKGVFNIVRHPIYLGAILLYLGLVLLTCSVLSFGLWIIIILFYYFISRYEEKIMVNQFGEEYRKYMEEVPMFLPFPRQRKRGE